MCICEDTYFGGQERSGQVKFCQGRGGRSSESQRCDARYRNLKPQATSEFTNSRFYISAGSTLESLSYLAIILDSILRELVSELMRTDRVCKARSPSLGPQHATGSRGSLEQTALWTVRQLQRPAAASPDTKTKCFCAPGAEILLASSGRDATARHGPRSQI